MSKALWALLLGNFVIGCGIMCLGGVLNDLTHDLNISVARGGKLIAISALVIGVSAPFLATFVARLDRRRLLAWTMVWFAIGFFLCAVAPSYEWLLPIRALTVLSGAVFTPQAAAVMGFMSTPAHRGRNITFVFMGWSVASVAGMPLSAWMGAHMGWRMVMLAVAIGSLISAWMVHKYLPKGIRPPALSWRAWRKVLKSPLLMIVVAVTAVQAAGQYTVLAYAAPYYKHVFGASPEQISLMFLWFGALALAGNIVLNRMVDSIGAAAAVTFTLCLITISLLIWPLATSLFTLALVLIPWALSGFATNSGQQARLGGLSPRLAPALMALNTSAIYLGHAMGASGGGWVLSHHSYAELHWLGLIWIIAGVGMSAWAQRVQHRRDAAHQRGIVVA